MYLFKILKDIHWIVLKKELGNKLHTRQSLKKNESNTF